MSISNYLENELLDQVFLATVYVSLHSSDCGETGANELTGGSYARQLVAFDAAAAGATQNSGAITWTGLPAGPCTHVGCWDSISGGNFLWGGALAASKTFNAGDTFVISAGDLDITLD